MSLVVPSLRGIVASAPWAKNELWRKAQAVPTLDLRFADSKSLTDAVSGQNLITFTRASSGTYVGSDGLIKTALADVPRFDHDPETGESLGLLIEEQRTNLLLQSEEFDDVAWVIQTSTVEPNATTAPDGNLTGDLLIPNNGSGLGSRSQTLSKAASPITYTLSCFAKQKEHSLLRLIIRDPVNSINRCDVVVDVTNGSLSGNYVGGTYSGLATTFTNFANGWIRFSLTTTTGSETSVRGQIVDSTSGDGTSGIYLWGAQLEAGSSPTSYIPTTSAQVTRNADVATITGSNFSSWYRQDEGTVFTSQKTYAAESTPGAYWFQKTGVVGRGITAVFDTRDTAQRLSCYVRDDVLQGAVSVAGLVDDAIQNVAHAWSGGTTSAALNGTSNTGNYNAVYPGIDTLNLGYTQISAGSPARLNGTISRLTFFDSRLPDATLEVITSP